MTRFKRWVDAQGGWGIASLPPSRPFDETSLQARLERRWAILRGSPTRCLYCRAVGMVATGRCRLCGWYQLRAALTGARSEARSTPPDTPLRVRRPGAATPCRVDRGADWYHETAGEPMRRRAQRR